MGSCCTVAGAHFWGGWAWSLLQSSITPWVPELCSWHCKDFTSKWTWASDFSVIHHGSYCWSWECWLESPCDCLITCRLCLYCSLPPCYGKWTGGNGGGSSWIPQAEGGIHTEWLMRLKRAFLNTKFHTLLHYLENSYQLGAPNNFSTETPESLHICMCKDPYRASNCCDFDHQILNYLDIHDWLTLCQLYEAERLKVKVSCRDYLPILVLNTLWD